MLAVNIWWVSGPEALWLTFRSNQKHLLQQNSVQLITTNYRRERKQKGTFDGFSWRVREKLTLQVAPLKKVTIIDTTTVVLHCCAVDETCWRGFPQESLLYSIV